MGLFESVHSYNKRHLEHIDKWIELVSRCKRDCSEEDKDLLPFYQKSLDLWHEARKLVDSGRGDLADGIKYIAQGLHEKALWTSVRRLQKRLKSPL